MKGAKRLKTLKKKKLIKILHFKFLFGRFKPHQTNDG